MLVHGHSMLDPRSHGMIAVGARVSRCCCVFVRAWEVGEGHEGHVLRSVALWEDRLRYHDGYLYEPSKRTRPRELKDLGRNGHLLVLIVLLRSCPWPHVWNL